MSGADVAPVMSMLRGGKAELEGLRPGRWKVELNVPGESGEHSAEVEVETGKTAELRFPR